MRTVTLDGLRRIAKLAIKADTPLTVLGPPGAGKTATFEALAREEGIGFVSKSLVHCDPTDVIGLPKMEHGRTSYLPPDWIPLKEDKSKPERGILLLDDVPDAPKAVQASIYELVNNRRVSGCELKPGWLPVMLGNRSSDLSAAEPMSFALVNRGAVVTYAPNAQDTAALAIMLGWGDPLPGYLAWSAATNHEHSPNMDKVAEGDYAQPTNRAFGNLSKAIGAGAALEQYSCYVGDATGARIYDYVKLLSTLPTMAAILTNPGKAPIPDSLGAQYAVAAGVARQVIVDPATASRLEPYVTRMAKALQTYYRQAVIRAKPSIVMSAGWQEWAGGIYA